MAGRLAQLEAPKGRLGLSRSSTNPKIQGLLVEAQKAQEEARKANSFGGLLKQTVKEVGNKIGGVLPGAKALVESAKTKSTEPYKQFLSKTWQESNRPLLAKTDTGYKVDPLAAKNIENLVLGVTGNVGSKGKNLAQEYAEQQAKINKLKGVIPDSPAQTLKNVEARVGVKPVEKSPFDILAGKKLTVEKGAFDNIPVYDTKGNLIRKNPFANPNATSDAHDIQEIRNSIDEGKTLLRGNLSPEKRAQIVRSVENAQTKIGVEKKGGYTIEEVSSDQIFNTPKVNRAEYDVDHFKRKPVELPQKLQEKELDIQLRKQYVEESPLNKLSKYESKTDKGRLPEVLGTGKSKFAREGDDIVDQTMGYKKSYAQANDSEKVRADYEKFAQDKQALKADELAFKDEVKKYKDSEKVRAYKEKSEKALGRQIALTSKEKGIIDGRVSLSLRESPPAQVGKTPLLKVPSKNAPLLSGRSEGELRTLEESARQSFGKANQGGRLGDVSLIKMIEKSPTPVNRKVGILDYLRTPDRVLKKIGLSKNANEIRVQYDKYLEELPKNIDKITEWSKRVPKESNERIFKYLDGQAVDLLPEERKVAVEIKVWLEDWAERLKLPADNRLSNYITHIFDDQLIKKEFDEDLAKIIADKVPGSVYDPFLQKRLGAQGYKQDVWAALDAYVKRATRKVHMDPALTNLEEVAGHLEQSQWEYVKKYADRINLRPTDWDTKFDNSLKQVVGYRFGQRPVANLSRSLRQMTFRGMLGGNISSALRNLSQGVNTYSKLGEKHTANGYLKLITKGTQELKDQGILRDNFIQDRTLSSTKKFMERLDKGLFLFFDMAEKINRGAAYYGAKSKALAQGMDETKAIEFAKKIVRDTQFLYSNVDTPLMMQGDIAKVMMQFMSYPVKQTEFLVEMAKNKEFSGLLRYVLGGVAFVYTAGKLMNMEPKELIPWSDYLSGDRKFGTPPSLKFPWEVVKAGMDTKDQYGNDRSLSDKARDIGKTLTGVIPAGVQLKKTFEGIGAFNQGASTSQSGRVRYPIEQGLLNRARTATFGQYSTGKAREYFDNEETPLSDKQSEFVLGQEDKVKAFEQIKTEQAEAKAKDEARETFKTNVYQKVQDLIKTNPVEADRMVQDLSPEDQELYKSVRTAERSKNTENLHDLLRRSPVEAVKFVRGQNEREKARLVERLNDKDSFTDEERALYREGKQKLQ